MSGPRAAANRPHHPLREADLKQALEDAESFEIELEATPWPDVHRAWTLAQASLRYADAIYVAAAELHRAAYHRHPHRALPGTRDMPDHHHCPTRTTPHPPLTPIAACTSTSDTAARVVSRANSARLGEPPR